MAVADRYTRRQRDPVADLKRPQTSAGDFARSISVPDREARDIPGGVMPEPSAETVAQLACRCAVVQVIRSHPEWSLGQIFDQLTRKDARSEALRSVTIGELLAPARDQTAERRHEPAGVQGTEPQIDMVRLRRASNLFGERFDAIVLEAIGEAGHPVAASYMRARVGGPRWKLQASFRRLAAKGAIQRRGNTSDVRYFLTPASEPTA